MGTHTWFTKDGNLHLEYIEKRDSFNDDTTLGEYNKWMTIHSENEDDDYFNLFRASGPQDNWEYLDNVYLRSYEDTMEFINNPYHQVREGDYSWEEGMRLLKEYWEKYPNGLIYFG
jgi:hypothetical protein